MNKDEVDQAMRVGSAFNAPENRLIFHNMTTVTLEHFEALARAGWRLREIRPDLHFVLGWLPLMSGIECGIYVKTSPTDLPFGFIVLDPEAEKRGRADRPWAVLVQGGSIKLVPDHEWYSSEIEALIAWLLRIMRS